MDAFIGEIRMFAGNFAPQGWMFCQGQILPIEQFTSLYSLLGTIYGGDGIRTFALPDLRGRVPVGEGQGQSLSWYQIGQSGGAEHYTLNSLQIPATSQVIRPNTSDSSGDELAVLTPGHNQQQPFYNMQPFLAINFIIAVAGIYPSRE